MFEESDDDLRQVANELRQPVAVSRDFDARVMRRVRASAPARRPWWAALTARRTITVTPLRLAAAAAALVAAVLLGLEGPRAMSALGAREPSSAGRHAGAHRVQFVLVAPAARKVAVVGDFNGWDATHAAYQARHRGGGVWSVTAPVPVGHHRYSFVVDDTIWVADPTAPRVVDNDFGLPNSALVVEEDQ